MEPNKPAKIEYYNAPRWSYEFLDCSMPMAFDTYNYCTYQCLYCFTYYQNRWSKDYVDRKVKYVNVDRVKKMFLNPPQNGFGDIIRNRMPMQWGSLAEPFDILLEPKYGITLELLKFFREINYPIAFSTKSRWFLDDKRYVDVIRGAKNFHFKVSIITYDEEKARAVEQGVPTPKERLETIKILSELDTAGVNLRLRPFIIGVSDPSHLQLIRDAAKMGAQGVSTEFFCVEGRATELLKKRYLEISRQCGYDVLNFYKRYSTGAGFYRLNYEIKRPYVLEMERVCKESGINLFISDANHKERCPWGSCCGLPKDWKFAKCQFTQAIVIAREKGEVKFSDISKEECQFLKTDDASKGHKMIGGSTSIKYKSMYDYMRTVWNTPKKSTSPYHYFDKMLLPDRLDENGDVVYKFNRKKYDRK
jgi:DNA repair photolyase